MTSATIKPARSAGGRHGEGQWMIIFAAVLLALWGLCAYGSRENLAA